MSMPPLSDVPAKLTESEDRIIRGLVHQLRDVRPPNPPPPPPPPPSDRGKALALVVAVASPFVTLLGGGYFMTSYWRGVEATDKRFAAIEVEQVQSRKERAELKSTVEQIQRERSARIADLDQWRGKTEDELRLYRVGYSDFRKVEGVVAEHGKKLSDGREERLRDRETDRAIQQKDREQMVDAINSLKTEVALLRQSVERGGRRGDGGPFDQNQKWSGLLAPHPFLKVTLPGDSIGGAARRVADER